LRAVLVEFLVDEAPDVPRPRVGARGLVFGGHVDGLAGTVELVALEVIGRLIDEHHLPVARRAEQQAGEQGHNVSL
jgi:hypothetical protein